MTSRMQYIHATFQRGFRLTAIRGGLGILLLLSLLPSYTAGATPAADVTVGQNQAVLDFPNTVTFNIQVRSTEKIQRIVLEYGVYQLTCGEVVAKAFPNFTPSAEVTAEWTWDMRQSGSEPPGAHIWWQWRVIDAKGGESLTGRKDIIWLDSSHAWKSVSDQGITLHWYDGGQSYGSDLLDSAVRSLQAIDERIALKPDINIDLFIYSDYDDLRDAILFEPGWTGGMSYGEYAIILLGIQPGDEDWGKGAIAHELMHTVVDRNIFSCLVGLPAWLSEGLAMISEGGPGQVGMDELQAAIDDNTLFPVRSLSGGFPEDSDLASLAYDQSYSVVDFLLQEGDAARMRDLLFQLGDGTSPDDALTDLYGYNVNGLDAAWRESVGADPLPQERLEPTATPTIVPTFQPASNEPGAVKTSVKTPAARTATPTVQSGGSAKSPPDLIILLGVCVCLVCLVLLAAAGVAAAALIARRKQ
jgi:hypothetical protein